MATHVDLNDSIGFALKRLQQRMRSRMDGDLSRYGLTAPQFVVLALLDSNPGITNAELARQSFVAAPTMIRMVTAMEDAGLIVRDVAEGRMKRTALTDKGRARLAEAAGDVDRIEEVLTAKAGDNASLIMAWLTACADAFD
jgi:DNA-binding MarR family transcriptional regulator